MSYSFNVNQVPPWADAPEPAAVRGRKVAGWAMRADSRADPRAGGAGAANIEVPQAVRRWSTRMTQTRAPAYQHPDVLKEMDLSEPWSNKLESQFEEHGSPAYRRFARLRQWAASTLRSNPFVPFTMRGLTLVFSATGLGIACTVYTRTHGYQRNISGDLTQQPSTIMAICVLSIILVYLAYNMYDEFFGRPLGLRSGLSKLKFVGLDVLFICFASANLALAFNTCFDTRWVCQIDYYPPLCRRQKDLVGLLFVGLVLQLLAFGVSLFRMIDRATT